MDEVLPSIRNDGGYVNDETFLVKVLDSYLKQKTYCEKLINDLNNYKPYFYPLFIEKNSIYFIILQRKLDSF